MDTSAAPKNNRMPPKVSSLSIFYFDHQLISRLSTSSGCFLSGGCNFVIIAERTNEFTIDWTVVTSIRNATKGSNVDAYVGVVEQLRCNYNELCETDLVFGIDHQVEGQSLTGCVRRYTEILCLENTPIRGKISLNSWPSMFLTLVFHPLVHRTPTLVDGVLEATFRTPITISFDTYNVSPTKNEVTVFYRSHNTGAKLNYLPSQRLSLHSNVTSTTSSTSSTQSTTFTPFTLDVPGVDVTVVTRDGGRGGGGSDGGATNKFNFAQLVGIIAGSVVGGVLVVGISAYVLTVYCRSRKVKTVTAQPPVQVTPIGPSSTQPTTTEQQQEPASPASDPPQQVPPTQPPIGGPTRAAVNITPRLSHVTK